MKRIISLLLIFVIGLISVSCTAGYVEPYSEYPELEEIYYIDENGKEICGIEYNGKRYIKRESTIFVEFGLAAYLCPDGKIIGKWKSFKGDIEPLFINSTVKEPNIIYSFWATYICEDLFKERSCILDFMISEFGFYEEIREWKEGNLYKYKNYIYTIKQFEKEIKVEQVIDLDAPIEIESSIVRENVNAAMPYCVFRASGYEDIISENFFICEYKDILYIEDNDKYYKIKDDYQDLVKNKLSVFQAIQKED